MFYNKNEIARIVNLFHSIGYGCLLSSPGITMIFPKHVVYKIIHIVSCCRALHMGLLQQHYQMMAV